MQDTIFDKFMTFALIDLNSLARNVRALASHVGPQVEIFAVVKANAYGHGMIPVSQVALDSGATRLAVARVGEGVELRRASIEAPILVMGYFVASEIPTVIDNDLTATVNAMGVAQALAHQAGALGKVVKVHVKVDTGMGRYGLLPEDVIPFVEQLAALPNLDMEGIFTHFAVADLKDKTYTHLQFTIFRDVLQALREAGYKFRIRHAANSAATLDLPISHLDAVRTGVAMYGLHPSSEVIPAIPLAPVLTLKSHVARVRTLPGGSSISYGRTHVTTGPTPVALVPIGYGDGYHRALSNQGHVLIKGQRAAIVGRVCMDQMVVDVSGIEDVVRDEEVVIIGRQGKLVITAEEVAALAGTINYEVTTSLLPRVPRVYLHGDRMAVMD